LWVIAAEEDAMATITAIIQRRPAPASFPPAFAISWGGVLAVIGGHGGVPGTQDGPHARWEALP
jgi:hypothetical protein